MKWQKGECGNPGGLSTQQRRENRRVRKAIADLLAEESPTEKGTSRLKRILRLIADRAERERPDNLSLKCADLLLDRMIGKVATPVELRDPAQQALDSMSEEELEQFAENGVVPAWAQDALSAAESQDETEMKFPCTPNA